MLERENLRIEKSKQGEAIALRLNPRSLKPALLRFTIWRQITNNPPNIVTIETGDLSVTLSPQQIESARKLESKARKRFVNLLTARIKNADWLLIQKPNTILPSPQTERNVDAGKQKMSEKELVIQRVMRGPNKLLTISPSRSAWFKY